MSVAFWFGIVYGLFFGALAGLFIFVRLNPWRWAWLKNKVSKKTYGVAVLVSKAFGGIPIVVPKGEVITAMDKMWVWDDDLIIPINPDDGSRIISKAQKVGPEVLYKVNGVPTVFLDMDDMRPLKLEGHGKEIPPDKVRAIVDRYVSVRQSQALATNKRMNLIMMAVAVGVAISLVVSILSVYYILSVKSTLNDIKQRVKTLTSPGLSPGPPPTSKPPKVEANTGIIEGNGVVST